MLRILGLAGLDYFSAAQGGYSRLRPRVNADDNGMGLIEALKRLAGLANSPRGLGGPRSVEQPGILECCFTYGNHSR